MPAPVSTNQRGWRARNSRNVCRSSKSRRPSRDTRARAWRCRICGGWPWHCLERNEAGGPAIGAPGRYHDTKSASVLPAPVVVVVMLAGRSRNRGDRSVEALRLFLGAGGEEERARLLRQDAISERQAPQPVDLERLAACVAQLALE